MRKHWARGRGAVIGVMVALVACSTGLAQKLDLDSSGAFKDGERTVEQQRQKLRDGLRELNARTAKADGEQALLLKSQNRVQELALALLDAGSSMGEGGSVHILTGRRVLARAAELEKAISDVWRQRGGENHKRLEEFLKSCPADAKAVPRSVEELDDVLARAFGQLTDQQTAGAWPLMQLDPELGSAASLRKTIDEAAKVKGVTPEAVTTLNELATSLDAAQKASTPPAYVAADRQLIVQGAASVLQTPKWMSPKAAVSLASAFDGVVRRYAVEDMRDSARADMCRLAIMADVLKRIDTARLSKRQVRSLRAGGAELAELVSEGGNECDDALAALRRGLILLETYDGARWKENRRVVREVRPIWVDVEVQGRRSRDELIEALIRLTPTTPALSDPAVLGAMSALHTRLDDGRRLCIVSAWLAGDAQPGISGLVIWNGTPAASPDGKTREPVTKKDDRTRRQAGIKLLALGQKIRDPETHDGALSEFRALADGLGAWMPIRGEEDLRAAATSADTPVGVVWGTLTGGAAGQIAAAIDESRQAWLDAWAGVKEPPGKGNTTPPPEPDLGRISALRGLVEMVADCAVAEDMKVAREWPGFEVSAPAISAALAPFKSDLSRAGGLVISAGYTELAASVEEMRTQSRLVGALANLERAARAMALVDVPMVHELAYPPPPFPTLGENLTPGVWLQREQDSIALICRCLEEHADAAKAADRVRAAALLKRATDEVQRLEQLPR